MTPQAYKDEVQPGEKAPAGDENTTDAFLYPPQQKKSKPYMGWFIIAGVCVVVGLLCMMIGVFSWYTNEGVLVFILGSFFAFIGGVAFFLTGLLVYLLEKMSR